jgi:hypothetical protein
MRMFHACASVLANKDGSMAHGICRGGKGCLPCPPPTMMHTAQLFAGGRSSGDERTSKAHERGGDRDQAERKH